jgi:hypothetical protein
MICGVGYPVLAVKTSPATTKLEPHVPPSLGWVGFGWQGFSWVGTTDESSRPSCSVLPQVCLHLLKPSRVCLPIGTDGGLTIVKHAGNYSAILALCLLSSVIGRAQGKSGVLTADEVKQVVPAAYFFRGQSATVQLRNSCGFHAGDKFVLAGLVDTSGYSSDIQAKYQGFLITEVKLSIGGTDLAPGEYGFGFSKDGKFTVLDVGANDLFAVDVQKEDKLAHPVPLKMVADGDGYRLYSGRNWVALKAE